MWNKIKVNLWHLGILKENKCPICSDILIKKGYDVDNEPGLERYVCSDDKCIFNMNKGYCRNCGSKLNESMIMYDECFCSFQCHHTYYDLN